jgi:hypothetical protein
MALMRARKRTRASDEAERALLHIAAHVMQLDCDSFAVMAHGVASFRATTQGSPRRVRSIAVCPFRQPARSRNTRCSRWSLPRTDR